MLKNCYGPKHAVANWFSVLQTELEDRDFQQRTGIDPCLFTRDDFIIATHVDDCLIFYENDNSLKELIALLEKEFKRTDEGDIQTFLRSLFKNYSHNTL